MLIKKCVARKKYSCDFSDKPIKVGEKYKRVNVNYLGIFHFNINIPDCQIIRFINEEYAIKVGGDW